MRMPSTARGWDAGDMLPITKVVLFKHGVGYFERSGTVTDDARVELSFRATEMNDVLKSLTVLGADAGGGADVTSISYESTQPLSRQLEDLAIDLPPDRAISGLLTQLVGAAAVVRGTDGEHAGTIAGVEPVRRRVGREVVEDHRIALWVDGAAIEGHLLSDVAEVRLTDPGLRGDLQRLLDILISAKKKDRKRLTLFARGSGPRELRVSYVVETPVWKTSYRVLLYDEAEHPAQVQGWAMVDNTGDEDWSNVALSLVAGLPVSFVHDLYSPRHRRRPEVLVDTHEAYAPPVLERSMAPESVAGGAPPPAPAMAAAMAAPAPKGGPGRARTAPGPPPPPSAALATRTQEVGDLLHYEIDEPVTVGRMQSALVPLLHRPFEGKRVAVYNAGVRAHNPMAAIEFHNTTGLTLEGGPVTVIENGGYVGEAMLDTLEPDATHLVAYCVELGCRIREEGSDRATDVQRVKVANGRVHLIRHQIFERHYVIDNRTDRDLDLRLDHPVRPGFSLHETPEPDERTDGFWRFGVEVGPRSATRFTVRELGERTELISVSDLDLDRIGIWFRQSHIDAALRDALEAVARLGVRRAQVQRRAAAVKAEVERIHREQGRLRANLEALGDHADERRLRQRIVTELTGQEDRLSELAEEAATLAGQNDALDRELREAIDGLDPGPTTAKP